MIRKVRLSESLNSTLNLIKVTDFLFLPIRDGLVSVNLSAQLSAYLTINRLGLMSDYFNMVESCRTVRYSI